VSSYSGMAAVRSAPDSTGQIGAINCLFDGWKPSRFFSGGVQPLGFNIVFRYLDAKGQAMEELRQETKSGATTR